MLRVLVVDNDSDSSEMLSAFFALHDIEAIAAKTADEALDVLRQVKPDLLVSEINLPYEDGYSLMHKLRMLETAANGQQAQIPAIAVTTCTKADDRAHALAVGFRKHLPKPINLDALIQTIADLTQLQGVTA